MVKLEKSKWWEDETSDWFNPEEWEYPLQSPRLDEQRSAISERMEALDSIVEDACRIAFVDGVKHSLKYFLEGWVNGALSTDTSKGLMLDVWLCVEDEEPTPNLSMNLTEVLEEIVDDDYGKIFMIQLSAELKRLTARIDERMSTYIDDTSDEEPAT